ncbi:MAG: hypothetical protein QM487_12305 [Candidatus Marithrix sp.]
MCEIDEVKKYSPRNYLLWKYYDKDVELYKFYIDIIIKAGVFIFAITGWIVSYYFANETNEFIHFSLILPIIFNGGLFVLVFTSIPLSKQLAEEHIKIEKELISGLNLEIIPLDLTTLTNVLRLFSIVHGFTSGALILFFSLKFF